MAANFKDILTLVVNADTAKAQAGIGGLKKQVIGMIGVFGGFIAAKKAFTAVVDAAAASEKVYTALGVSIDNSGRSFEKLEPVIRRYTDRIQRTTGQSDELVAQGLQMATQFGIELPEAMRVTNAALDISAARNISLTTAVDLLGKAFVGDTALLKRYGIVIDESIPKADKFEAVMAKVNKQFGGQATKAMDTYAGKVSLLEQRWGDFLENVGGPITDFLSELLDRLNLATDVTELSVSWWEALTLQLGIALDKYGGVKIAVEALLAVERQRQQQLDAEIIAGGNLFQSLADKADSQIILHRSLLDEMIDRYRVGDGERATFTNNVILSYDKMNDSHVKLFKGMKSRENRFVQNFSAARQQESIDFEEEQQQRLAIFTDVGQQITDIAFDNVANTVIAWAEGRDDLSEIWRNMALDFVALFVNTILNSVKVKAVAGIVGILGSIFDKPANDAKAINQGRHYAKLWQNGAVASFKSFVPQVANTPAAAIAGSGLGATGGGSLNIIAPIVSSRFFAESRASLETMARRNNLQLNTRRVSAMQVTAPRFI